MTQDEERKAINAALNRRKQKDGERILTGNQIMRIYNSQAFRRTASRYHE